MERNRLKILVTGGAGFVGTNLIKILQKTYSNSEIQVIDNYVTGFIRNHQEGVTYHDVDITTEQATSLMISFQPDVIYHLAALARIQPSFKYPTPTFNANVIGTQRVLEYARTNKTPVIYAGSSSTHGGVHKNPYTFSKWLGEELCIMYSKIFDVPTIITRFYNVYGEYMIPGDHAYSTVVQIFNEQKLNNIPLTITGDGEQRRDFTHVLDICDALVTCIDHPNLKAEIFELGRGENFSINEIAKMYNHPITYIPSRLGETKNTLADFSKATKILGYKPFRNIKDWIQK
jgi:nucleoside-diphosphate-sugar epimerase